MPSAVILILSHYRILPHRHFVFTNIMFGFGGGSKPADTGAAPTREQRKQCWETRDAYYACLDRNEIIQPGDGALSDVKGVCADFRKAYEASCTNSWVGAGVRR